MNRTPTISTVLVALAVAAPAAWLLAGNLTPPVGPVAPTMKTNQAIFDAVQGVGGSAGACTPAISGLPRGLGTITFSSLPGAGGGLGPFPVYSFKAANIANQAGSVTVTRDMDAASHRIFGATVNATPIATITITLSNGTQDYFSCRLTDSVIEASAPSMVERCDGTTAQVEDLVIRPMKVRYTDLIGNNFTEFNNAPPAVSASARVGFGGSAASNKFGVIISAPGSVAISGATCGTGLGTIDPCATFSGNADAAGVGDIAGTANANCPWANFAY